MNEYNLFSAVLNAEMLISITKVLISPRIKAKIKEREPYINNNACHALS